MKKPKIEPTDENDNISEDQITNSTHKILFSMITDTKEMKKIVRQVQINFQYREFTVYKKKKPKRIIFYFSENLEVL